MDRWIIAVLVFTLSVLRTQGGGAMVVVPGGTYTNVYVSQGIVTVRAFEIDRHPVTNREYLEFVRSHPEWMKSRAPRTFVDETYLGAWAGDLEPGAKASLESPVTHVSWFAARAYATSVGKRLPTQAEWELAARATLEVDRARILRWYATPQRGPPGVVGSTWANELGIWDLHGLVWEWVGDFATALVTGESRADSGLDTDRFCGSGAANASSFDDYAAFMRYAFRSSLQADYCLPNLGFRCAQEIEP